MDRYVELPLEQIDWPDPMRDFSRRDIENMAKSINTTGIIHAIVVEKASERERFNGVTGRLRFEGSKHLGRLTIPCRIHHFIDKSQKKAWQLVENVVRKELNPIEIGEGYAALRKYYLEETTVTDDKPVMQSIQAEVHQVSTEPAPSKRTIWHYIQFANDFTDEVKNVLKSVTRNTFGTRHAIQLLRLKDDHGGMLKMAEYVITDEPTSAQLKREIDDYLKVEKAATKEVKQAVEDRVISLKHAAAISEANESLQEPILALTRRGPLKPTDTKKVVDFVEAHPEAADILEKSPEKAVAIAEGKEVLETPEDVRKFFRGKKGLAEEEKFSCPNCAIEFTADWAKGEIRYGHSKGKRRRKNNEEHEQYK